MPYSQQQADINYRKISNKLRFPDFFQGIETLPEATFECLDVNILDLDSIYIEHCEQRLYIDRKKVSSQDTRCIYCILKSIQYLNFMLGIENIGGGMTAPWKSAVGWKKNSQKTCAAMSFSLFSLHFKQKLLVVMVSINFFTKLEHFDIQTLLVAILKVIVMNKKVTNF